MGTGSVTAFVPSCESFKWHDNVNEIGEEVFQTNGLILWKLVLFIYLYIFLEFQDNETQLQELIYRHKSFIVGDFPSAILIKIKTSHRDKKLNYNLTPNYAKMWNAIWHPTQLSNK